MSRADRPVRTTSLQLRVTASVLGFILIVLVLLGLTVNWLLGARLRADVTQRLLDRAAVGQLLAKDDLPVQEVLNRLTGGGITARAVTPSGAVLYGQDVSPPRPPGTGDPAGHRRPPAPPQKVTLTRAGNLLSATVDLGAGRGTVVLQTGEGEVGHTLALLRRTELIAGTITLALTGLLLTRVVSVALAPLGRMTGLARRTRDGARGRRLRPTRPNTDIGRTAAAFDDMLDALASAEARSKAAEDRMRQFLAGAEQLLQTDAPRRIREDRLVAIVREGRRAARMVDDLLLMTRLESGLEPGCVITGQRPVDLAELIARECDGLAVARPDLTVDLHPARGDGVWVRGDVDQLRRAVGNLIGNGADFSPHGGRLRISLSAGPRTVVLVEDSGPGVPGESRERIFDRLVRLSSARSGSGSGLGLPIARTIARAHGGEVRCRDYASDLGGAVFELELPAGHLADPDGDGVTIRTDEVAALSS